MNIVFDLPWLSCRCPNGHQRGCRWRSSAEAADVAQRKQAAFVGLEVCECVLQVHDIDPVGRIGRRWRSRVRDLDDLAPLGVSHQLPSFVGADGYQPRAQAFGFTQRAEPLPGDGPGVLCRIACQFTVTDDDVGGADHGLVVFRDELREGDLVARGGQLQCRRCGSGVHDGALHVMEMSLTAEVSQDRPETGVDSAHLPSSLV
jgi:hypothetical protein